MSHTSVRRHSFSVPFFQDKTITRAMDECIRPKLNDVKDTYSLALLAYSLTIAKHPSKNKILKSLERRAIVEGIVVRPVMTVLILYLFILNAHSYQ